MVLYRYEGSVTTEFISLLSVKTFLTIPKITLVTFEVFKETPKGYWICEDAPIWVSKTSIKRYAYPTKEDALKNYIARTNKHIRLLKAKISKAEKLLKEALKLK